MSNETDVRRGQRAKEVLDNEIYVEAWEMIEQELIRQWRESRDADDREQLHRLLLAHEKAKVVLESVMRVGQIAEGELSRKMQRAEQFGRATYTAR